MDTGERIGSISKSRYIEHCPDLSLRPHEYGGGGGVITINTTVIFTGV